MEIWEKTLEHKGHKINLRIYETVRQMVYERKIVGDPEPETPCAVVWINGGDKLGTIITSKEVMMQRPGALFHELNHLGWRYWKEYKKSHRIKFLKHGKEEIISGFIGGMSTGLLKMIQQYHIEELTRCNSAIKFKGQF